MMRKAVLSATVVGAAALAFGVAGCSSSSSSAASGSGSSSSSSVQVGVILPDTVSSARYVNADAPALAAECKTKSLNCDIQNAQGVPATQQSLADKMINTEHVQVLVIDPLNPTVGAAIEKEAHAAGVASGEMFYRIRDRKRWSEFLDFLRQMRRRFPGGRLYVVLDNFSPHKKKQVRDWCQAHDVELVFTPTNASWTNWIECEFTALRYFALNGSDYPDHKTQDAAIGKYVRWRNKHAKPKTNFAIGSKIREPDYLPLSA